MPWQILRMLLNAYQRCEGLVAMLAEELCAVTVVRSIVLVSVLEV
jgi:hypothetical protein